MANNLTVFRHEGSNQEQFLAIETPVGIVGKATEEITVPEGAAFVSLFLTRPAAEGFERAPDVSARLISPARTAYGGSENLPAGGQDVGPVEVSTTQEIGQIIYLARPAAGKWTVELEAEASSPFSCEIRVLPDITIPPSSDQAARQSLADFGRNLPRTMITDKLYEALGQQVGTASPRPGAEEGADSSVPDCKTCQTAIAAALIAFGLAALFAAALLMAFNPPAYAVALALIAIGVIIAVDAIIGFFINLAGVIRKDTARAVTLLSWDLCRSIGSCG